jgi:hypothetical protein
LFVEQMLTLSSFFRCYQIIIVKDVILVTLFVIHKSDLDVQQTNHMLVFMKQECPISFIANKNFERRNYDAFDIIPF